MGIFVNQEKIHPYSVFSLFWGENILVSREENTWAPLFIFIPLYPTKHTPKKFFLLFSLQSFTSTIFHFQTNTPLKPPISKAPK